MFLCAYLYGKEKYVCILRKRIDERAAIVDTFLLVLDTYLTKYPNDLVVVMFDDDQNIIVTWPLETPTVLLPVIKRALFKYKEGGTLEQDDLITLAKVVGQAEYEEIRGFPETYHEKATDNLGKYCERIEEVS